MVDPHHNVSRIGAFPGSFNPPTLAHLAIALAAIAQHHLDRVDLVVSEVALAKAPVIHPLLAHRIEVLRASCIELDALGVVVTRHQLVADLSDGYDVVIIGADKWHQIHDPQFYGASPVRRDAALARLPTVAIAPRPPLEIPSALALDLPAEYHPMSSTGARSGRREWMTPQAVAFDDATGAWSDPDRYASWLARSQPGD